MSSGLRCLCWLVLFYLKGVYTSTCGFTNFIERWYKNENEIANISYILNITDGPDVSVSLNILFEVCENNYLQTRCNCILSKPSNKPVSVVQCMGTNQVCVFTNQSLGSVDIHISYPLSLPLSVMRLSWRSRSSAYETARMIRLHVSSYPPISYRPGDVKGQTPETVKHKGDVTYSANSKSNGLSTGYQDNGFEQKTSASFDVPRNCSASVAALSEVNDLTTLRGLKKGMTCSIESSRLHCTSTNPIEGLSLYSKPDAGDERRVFICPSLSDKECSNFNGVRLITPTNVEITLSEHENITYRCVMRGSQSSETQRCRWTPGAESQNGTSTVETYTGKMKELTLGKAATFSPEPEIKDISTETIIGAVFGVLVAIILIMAVGYLLFRHFKLKRNLEGPRKRSISCIKAQKRELCAWYICADNDLNSQAAVGADASPTPLLPSNSAHTPNREEENSKMKDDDEVSTSVIKIKNGGLGTLGEKKHINGKT